MKRTYLLSLMLMFHVVALSQTSGETKSYRNVLVIETFPILSNLFTPSNQSPVSGMPRYWFNYRRICDKNSLRFQFAFTQNNQKIGNMNTENKSRVSTISIHIGFEHRIFSWKRFVMFTGADAVFSERTNKTISENYFLNVKSYVTNRRNLFMPGIYVFTGLQFRINPRIYLSSEIGLNANGSLEYNKISTTQKLPVIRSHSSSLGISTSQLANLQLRILF